jgi:adenosylhomocysteine nucleosidase
MLGIIGAMDEEVEQLKAAMDNVEIQTRASMDFYKGTMEGKDIVVVRSGIGKVNAGICTQILVDVYGVNAVVNTGIAGSLNADIDIGDIVLSTDALQHDMDATGFGYELGVIPRMENSIFEADKELVDIARNCCLKVNPDIKVFCGRVVSGDQFISDKEVKNRILENFSGYCTEMEGAAVAQAAWLNKIPFLIIRAISDKADDSATEDYPAFEAKAIMHTVKLVKEIVSQYN